MIITEPNGRNFHLLTERTLYSIAIREDGKPLHVYWGPRPAGSVVPPAFRERLRLDSNFASQDDQTEHAELVTYGDVAVHGVSLKANVCCSDGFALRDCRLRFREAQVTEDSEPGYVPTHGQDVRNPIRRETLKLILEDELSGLVVVLCYRVVVEQDLVERYLELTNSGDGTVSFDILKFGTVCFPAGCTELTSLTGRCSREFEQERQVLRTGDTMIGSHGLIVGHDTNPAFLLNRPGQAWEESGTVYFGALAWSGNSELHWERLGSDEIFLHAGYHPFDFELTLAPGESHCTPALILGCCTDGWGGASRRMHRLLRDERQPVQKDRSFLRPVLYNGWEAAYFDIREDDQMLLAEKAAAIGIELFCLDDGWFGSRRHDRAGLGDWFPAPELFPNGLKPLADHVHKLGMQFGLWVEPEMVNLDSDLYRAHPDWVLHVPGRPRRESRSQLILDFGRDEVCDYIANALDQLVRENDVDFFKWDMNRRPSETGSVAGRAIWQRHSERLYEIIDKLRADHPHLTLQSCASGGGRIDAGILGRIEQTWVSDNTDALDRIRIQEGFSLFYPARAMECWVSEYDNPQTGRKWPLSMRFDVAMRGNLGIASNLNKLSGEELAEHSLYIRFYKTIRPVVQLGDLYRLFRVEENGASVVEYALPDRSEAVVSVARAWMPLSRYLPPCPLRGLDDAAEYAIFNHCGDEIDRRSGFELVTRGMELNSFYESPWHTKSIFTATYHLRKV